MSISEVGVECEHSKLVKKDHEVVCVDCGLVVSDVEFVSDIFDGEGNLWEYTGLSLGSDRLTSRERTGLEVKDQIERLSQWLALPRYVVEQAIVETRKILKKVRSSSVVRVTASETAIIALLNACKITGFPYSIREFSQKMLENGLKYDENRIYSLLCRVSKLVEINRRLFKPKEYVPRIIGKIQRQANSRYISAVEWYACRILEENEVLLRNRGPVLAAAAGVCAADEILGGTIGRETVIEAVNAGLSLRILADKLGKNAPSPPEGASIFILEKIRRQQEEYYFGREDYRKDAY